LRKPSLFFFFLGKPVGPDTKPIELQINVR
jgi:hypothetical protein